MLFANVMWNRAMPGALPVFSGGTTTTGGSLLTLSVGGVVCKHHEESGDAKGAAHFLSSDTIRLTMITVEPVEHRAPLRMDIWRERREDALYLPALLSHLWGCVANYLTRRSERLLPA